MIPTHNPLMTLSNFRDARAQLPKVRPMLGLFGDVICSHNAEHLVGLNLLHRHFSIRTDEVLIRRLRNDAIECTIRPEPACTRRHDSCVPYLWKLQWYDETNRWQPIPLEYRVDNTGFFRERARTISTMSGLLDDIGTALHTFNLDRTLGITLVDPSVLTTGDQIALEEPGEQERSLKVTVQDRSVLNASDITEVSWYFTQDEETKKPDKRPSTIRRYIDGEGAEVYELPTDTETGFCFTHCKGHCKAHCSQHCRKHSHKTP